MQRASTRTVDSQVLLSLKAKIKGRRILEMAVSTLFTQDPSVSGVKASATWNKSALPILSQLGKVRHLLQPWVTPNLRMILKMKMKKILNAFTAIVNPTKGIVEDMDEEKELVESKFEKMDEQDDIHTAYAKLYKVSEKHKKLYRLAIKKLNDVELEWEELSIKCDEANQTIGALRFENNFLAEKTKKLEAELFL